MKRAMLAVVAAMAVLGCKQVEFKNGEVPDQYLSEAKKLEGVYQGSFAGDKYELKIQFEGNKPRLSLSGQDGTACKFVFGDVLAADVTDSSDSVKINAAYFDLQSESCFRAVGKEFELRFAERDGQIRIDTYLLQEQRYERECQWQGSPYPSPGPGPGPYPPGNGGGSYYVCRDVLRNYYLNGRFVR